MAAMFAYQSAIIRALPAPADRGRSPARPGRERGCRSPGQGPPPEQEGRDGQQRDEEGPEPDHHMVGVVEELDVVRPLVARNVVETAHGSAEVPVGEKAEEGRNVDRILQLVVLDVWLADDRDRRVWLALERALHGGQRRGLRMR